jgi:hypothetical protein
VLGDDRSERLIDAIYASYAIEGMADVRGLRLPLMDSA